MHLQTAMTPRLELTWKEPRAWKEEPSKDGEFTFEVKGKAGKVVATGSNKSDGSISFNNKLNYKLSDLEKADGSYEPRRPMSTP